MKSHFKEYFTFSKKERTGIVVLLLLILITTLFGYFLPVNTHKPDEATLRRFQQQVTMLKAAIDSNDKEAPAVDYAKPVFDEPAAPVALFAFDPNTLSPEGWKKLGLRERTINTIVHYREKGGRFRKPEDIYRIYGLKREEAERLIAYVHVAEEEPVQQNSASHFVYDSSFRKYDKPAYVKPAIIDVNAADTTAFIALRGIGSKLASRIVHFREKLGGFYAVEQVGETYGLPDSTFQQIRAFLLCNAPAVKQIDLNTADVAALREHPYIRWQLANAIVQYRQQHGAFQSMEQLSQINLVTPELLTRIRPYLVTNSRE